MDNIGEINIIGIGPGSKENMSIKALETIKNSDIIIGYKTYIELVKDIIKDKKVISKGMKKEVERAEIAFEYSSKGYKVSLISSGDPGIYGMAGVLIEYGHKENLLNKTKVEVISGISAFQCSSALLGAPIMVDNVMISLSDLLTDWSLIEKRIHLAAEGEFIIGFYNPKSKGRPNHINRAQEILLKYRNKDTLVGVVRNCSRNEESVKITTLEKFTEEEIDMFTMVIIGNSKTYRAGDFLVTPRGYSL